MDTTRRNQIIETPITNEDMENKTRRNQIIENPITNEDMDSKITIMIKNRQKLTEIQNSQTFRPYIQAYKETYGDNPPQSEVSRSILDDPKFKYNFKKY